MDNNSRDISLEKQIDAYIKGHLTPEEADRLWIELLKKPHYIDLLDTELHVKSIIEQQKQRGRTRFFGKSWKWVAAAVIGLLVVALSLLQKTEEENGRLQALPAISAAEHLASPEIVRADISDLSDADSMLSDGFKAAISGQFDRALQTYEDIISNYSRDFRAVSRAYFNTGIIRYNTGRFMESSAAFSQALELIEEDRILEEKAQWFLANAYIHLNQPEQAREAIEQVYSMDGIYRDQASDMLEKLNTEPSEE